MKTPGIGPVLVTGGNGFLGRAISGRMVDAGETVVSLDLAPTIDPVSGVISETGNILDIEAIHAMAKRHGVRAIVHLAAMVIPACRADPAKGAEVNVIGHINMLEVARRLGVRRFVYTSSVAAKPREPFNTPVNLYGAYKRCCEDISRIWYLDHQTPSIGIRPNVVYGPGREIGETAAITLAVKAAAQGASFQMPFAGAMCFQYVDEVVDVMGRCLALEPDSAYVSDLTTGTQTIDDVIAAIKKVSPEAKITPSEQIRPAPPQLDNAVLRTLIGEWPSVSLEEGVRRTHAHYVRSRD
ncbi:NAD(P)-dependent oxidoreductase [Hoeflea sp. WL0058]|uniref:NAD(P)-dependent oxidoreductase n=1 Tax=Flavimaribacter sediminis TaxID=2865987 RepID=A0AAE2ZNI8_9HYPH|nr:NAD(P)-dependent oxidoreductase [Flavimaribacter sediminis]MBW8637825.1 NAD(P)-dependent oxidoreductase [Flavimaribacter sediminis]